MRSFTFALLIVLVVSLSAWSAVRGPSEGPRSGLYELDCVLGAKKAGLRCHVEVVFPYYYGSTASALPADPITLKHEDHSGLRVKCTNDFEFESNSSASVVVPGLDDLILQYASGPKQMTVELEDFFLTRHGPLGMELTALIVSPPTYGILFHVEGVCEVDVRPLPTTTATATLAPVN